MGHHPVCPRCGSQITNREPWWAGPPKPGDDVLSLDWGYLICCEQLHWEFERIRPSDAEILNRKSCFLVGVADAPATL